MFILVLNPVLNFFEGFLEQPVGWNMLKPSIFGINSTIRGKSHLIIGVNLSFLASYKSIYILSTMLELIFHVRIVSVETKGGFWFLIIVLHREKMGCGVVDRN